MSAQYRKHAESHLETRCSTKLFVNDIIYIRKTSATSVRRQLELKIHGAPPINWIFQFKIEIVPLKS